MSSDLFDLTGRRALVSGGASGIGRICAEGLMAHGASVVVTSRQSHPEGFSELARSGCQLITIDLAQPDAANSLVTQYRSLQPDLDILVNNAGVTWGAPFDDYPASAWSKVFNLDVAVPFQLVQAFLPLLGSSARTGGPGRVVNIGSVDGHAVGSFDNFAYSAAKAAVHHMTRVLALRLAPRNVTVNCIAPGPIPTRMTTGILEAAGRGMAAANPLGRLTAANDIVGALIYLTAAAGAYITGATIPVDGGFSLGPWLVALTETAGQGTPISQDRQEDMCT
jgi:NAD(P)-dependent dehydrogenase (short-subunit alcohol dehydrogenase family)